MAVIERILAGLSPRVKVTGFWLGSTIPWTFPVQLSKIYPSAGIAVRVIIASVVYFPAIGVFVADTSMVPPYSRLLSTDST